ncbi:MAG: KR domain-containing protein, partial [Planctomycetes bacterium]|nr:KR domain-containing protein [Planctomycetota bacterium]
RYGLDAEDGVSLDDFPTLRHLIDYLVPRLGGPPAAASAPGGHGRADRNGGDQAGIDVPRASVAVEPAPTVPSPLVTAAGLAAEVESFLIEFVVEQTGYPAEIVELDADLEADLGIDSIRKAQLFGEVGQRYGLDAEDGVSLDDFPTLRHLIDYLVPRLGGPPAASATGASAAFARGVEVGRRHADAIRAWGRHVAGGSLLPTVVSIEGVLAEEAAGIATGAGVDEAIVRAGLVAPLAALGGCDVAAVPPAGATLGTPGLIACFGRHAMPSVTTFSAGGLSGSLVGVPGLPGAVLGWNDGGLASFVATGSSCDVPPGGVVERIVTNCRSLADATQVLSACGSPPCGLVVVSATGAVQVGPGGEVADAGGAIRRADAAGSLVRAALADGGHPIDSAVVRLLADDSAARDALSSACTWLCVGGAGAVASGGPRGQNWLAATNGLGPAWSRQDGATTDAAASVTRRYELELVDVGPTRAVRSLAGERVVILGTGPRVAALEHAVAALGATPLVVGAAAAVDAEGAAFALTRAEVTGPVRHLVVVAPQTETGTAEAIAPAFAACQKWVSARSRVGELPSATVTAVCDLGGGFGLSGSIAGPAGGGLAGLFKSLAREFPGLHVRVLDVAGTLAPEAAAAAAVAEMTDGAGPIEVGMVGGRRVTVVAVDRPLTAPPHPQAALARNACWLVTGGARGVTAACVRELGRRHGVSLVLVGSTHPVEVDPAWSVLPEPALREAKGRVMLDAKARGQDPRRAWAEIEKSLEIARSLAVLRAAGVTARYEACDLADANAVWSLVARVARDVGPIRGLVHGAGWESACRFEKKTLEGLARTTGPKCTGLEHLLAAVDPQSLSMLVGFGSTSGRLGGHGQADYSLANDMLAKLVAQTRQRRPGLRAATFHWHAWDEVGMASRPESRFVLEQFGLRFMPLAEGVARFLDEIEAGLPVAEVLVTEPAMVTHAIPPAAVARPPAVEPLPPQAGSLVESVTVHEAGATEVRFRLDPAADRFLIDHLQYGRPLLPAVMGAELLAQAAIAAGVVATAAEIRDFVVERPLNFPVDAPREVRVEVEPSGAARGLAAAASSDGRATANERVHFRGLIVAEAGEPIVAEVGEPPFPFNAMAYQEDGPMRHGASFRTLDGLFLDRAGGWGRLTAPRGDVISAPRGDRGWSVPAALLDGVIMGCAVYSFILCGRRVEIPVRFERLRLAAAARAGEKCTTRMWFRDQDARESVYDVVLVGDDRRPILAIDGLHLAVMAGKRSPPA